MAERARRNIKVIIPNRSFHGDSGSKVTALAVCPDGRRVVTSWAFNTLCLWDLKDRIVLRKIDVGRGWLAVVVSGDGQLVASGDQKGELIAWRGDTNKSPTRTIQGHSKRISSLDFSSDGAVLASGSSDQTTRLWCTETWHMQGDPIECGRAVNCVRFSPRGELLAIATDGLIEIWNPRTRTCVTKLKGHAVIRGAWNNTLTWTPDGTRLLSGGCARDPTIREWNTSTWKQVGDPWSGHTDQIKALTVNSTGTSVASASNDHVRLWRLSDERTVTIFKHSQPIQCITFSLDGERIFIVGFGNDMSEWAVPKDILEELARNKQILAINTVVRTACITWDLSTAEELLAQEINVDGNDKSYANRSLVTARKRDWDQALYDAFGSISIEPSLTGYIIALCGKKLSLATMKAFRLALTFTDEDSRTIVHLLLAISLFDENQHGEAILRVQELAAACSDTDTLTCRVVEAYLHVQLGFDAWNDARHDEAANHFTSAINTAAFSSEQPKYEFFVEVFGWDLKCMWESINQTRCRALLRTGRVVEACAASRSMIDMSDETTRARCRDWLIAFEKDCCALYTSKGDEALAAKDYEGSIELYSAAIELGSANGSIFAQRCRAKLRKKLWEDALLDAQKVIGLDPSSYHGYELKHEALHGAQQYDEAIAAFEIMLSRLNAIPDTRNTRKLPQQYIASSEAASTIQDAIHPLLANTPHRLFNTFTGRLCDREAQVHAFKTSTEYKQLLSSTMKHANRMEHIERAVELYFCCVMLSHRWGVNEPRLRDIQDKDIYEFDPAGSIVKLQSFCRIARDAGHRWAWVDTCCIDQTNNVEVQECVNSMFVWYRHSVLTIVYLSDVPPSSKSGALARSVWNKRGWTVQEFLAPKVVLFYQEDWTLYLDDHSLNHKQSAAIRGELGDATGIDPQALVAFHPGKRSAREKLQWVSGRVTTLPEDIAYSLFGIFDVHLPVIYGEKKQNALGRLLQEVVAQSGDISTLDWVGKPSVFNTCLPADITSYGVPFRMLHPPSEGEMETSVSSLRTAVGVGLASILHNKLDCLSAPRFAARRLQLPCIAFPVTEVRRRRGQVQRPLLTFTIKADGLRDLTIVTEDRLDQLWQRARRARQSFLLVRPWDRSLLDPLDFVDPHDLSDTESVEDISPPVSPSQDSSGESPGGNEDSEESYSQTLRLIVRLGQSFSALLLTQRGGEYKRIASDQRIIAQVRDMASVNDMMDVRTLEIL